MRKQDTENQIDMETPSKEIFDDMLQAATKVWQTYSDEFGYVTEKLNRINSLENYRNNAMVMYRMFDHINQGKMLKNLENMESMFYIQQNS